MQHRRRLTLPLVESWFDLQSPAPQATARALHAIVMTIAPDLEMAVRSGNLVYVWQRTHFLALVPHRTHMHLQVFDGTALARHFPALEGQSKGLRQLRLRHGQPFDEDLVRAIVQAALDQAAQRARESMP